MLQNEHKNKINEQSLHYSYQIDGLKEHCKVVERLLLKVNTSFLQVKNKITKAYEEKRLFTQEEVIDVETTVTTEQNLLNSLFFTHNS